MILIIISHIIIISIAIVIIIIVISITLTIFFHLISKVKILANLTGKSYQDKMSYRIS